MTRAFVALCLDDPTRRALAAEIERLRPLSHAVAWVPPQNLHLTLKFLGNQTDDGLTAAFDALTEAAATTVRFTLALHGLGAFPGMERPRILWVGVAEGGLEARALQARVDSALGQRGFAREDRAWHPHLTIGRVFDPRRWRRDTDPAMRQALARSATTRFGALPVDRIVLMRSELSRAGAHYHELHAVELGQC